MLRHCRSVSRAYRGATLIALGLCGEAGADGSPAPFTEEAATRGVGYVMQNPVGAYGYLGYGCGFVDLDGDDDSDIVIVGAADARVGIFENDGSGFFSDRSGNSGIPLLPEGSGFAAGDYDGDGDLDLYFTQVGLPNVLVRNDGSFQFDDVTSDAGVGDSGAGKGVCFGDFDNDGRLDLYVTNYSSVVLPPDQITRNNLYRNLGNGMFEDVAVGQGVDDIGQGFQAVWSDYDRDGDVDLYLSNDNRPPAALHSNQLWRNDGGQLVNVSEASGTDVTIFSMGLACGDFDGNRSTDFYVTNLPGGFGVEDLLLLNQGDGTFSEWGQPAGVDNPYMSWGALFADFNNNGHLDLYVNNMWYSNALYLNSGVFPSVEAGISMGVAGNSGASFSSAVGDVDQDGDLDILVNNLGGNVELFINHEGETRDWVRFRLVGQAHNLHAVGGGVDVRVGDEWRFREILAGGNGYLGQNELTIHVGLGDAEIVDEAVVRWPGGEVSRVLTHLPTNRVWHAYPPERLGDVDGDGSIDLSDFAVFESCGSGPSPDSLLPGCEMMDFDGDSDVDVLDFGAFQSAFGGG